MRKIFILCLCAAFFAAGCKKQPVENKPPAGALARVAGVYITQGDVDNAAATQPPDQQKYLQSSYGQQGVLDVLVREQIMVAAANAANVASEPAYKKQIEDMQKSFELRLAQAKKDDLIKTWLDLLRANGTISVSQAEIDDYYKKYKYEITIRQMVIASAADADAVLRAVRSAPDKPAKLAELSKKYALAPQGDMEKGALFTFIPGEYLPEIENAAANSPAGSVQGFIKTARGFHIIYKVKESGISKKDAQDRIVKIIERQKLDKYLDGLAEKYKTEVYKTYEN